MALQNICNYNTFSNSVLTAGTATFNTAVGVTGLANNPSGLNNSALGYLALNALTTGGSNTAVGFNALAANLSGSQNTALGLAALSSNTTANGNTALGSTALFSNVTGSNNTAVGFGSLFFNIFGSSNTAVGTSALNNLITGTNNTALGSLAGSSYISNNSNNISIGANVLGTAGESNVLRIGATATMARAFVGGVYGTSSTTGNAPVVVDPFGQVGMVGPLTDGQLLIGATGANPVAANLTAGSGVSIISGVGQITIASSGGSGMAWATVSGSLTASKNSGYIGTAGTVSIGLPTFSSIGDQVSIALKGGNQIAFTQAAGQSILFGTALTTVGTGGQLVSTSNGDLIMLLCTVGDTSWMVMNGQGNWTVI